MTMASIKSLPLKTILRIMQHVNNPSDLVSSALVCRQWAAAATDAFPWASFCCLIYRLFIEREVVWLERLRGHAGPRPIQLRQLAPLPSSGGQLNLRKLLLKRLYKDNKLLAAAPRLQRLLQSRPINMSAAPSPSASSGSEEDGTTTYTARCLYNDCGEEFTSSVSLRAANKQVGTHVTQAHSLRGITCCGKIYKYYAVWLEHKSGRGHKKRAKAANVSENTVIATNLQPSTSSSHSTAAASSSSASSSRRRRVSKAAIRTPLNAMPAADMLAPQHPILVKIKDQMDEKFITWEELADALSCSEQEVENMLNGRQRPSIEQIERLASKVGVKLDWMLYMWHRLARVVARS